MELRDESLEKEIQQVMQDTKMEYMQAYRHVQQRRALAARPDPFPLGKSAYIDLESV